MKIFEAIRKDHEKQRLLLKILLETTGDSEARRFHFNELKNELAAHASAEERHFYSPLMESDKTIDESRHAIHEHYQLDKLVETLDNTDMSSSAWMHYMKQLNEKLLHHLDEEEKEFFQQAKTVLDSEEKKALGDEFVEEKQKQLEDA
jgi:hemerythrin superfamily protein